MTDIKLKVVPMRPKRKVPPEAQRLTASGLTEQAGANGGSPLTAEIMASIDRLERMMLNFTKDLADIGSGLNFTEARLNRVVRLTKTLATIAGIPD